MNTKLLIFVLLGITFLFFGCAKKAPQADAPPGTIEAADEVPEAEEVPEEEPGAEVPEEEEPEAEVPEEEAEVEEEVPEEEEAEEDSDGWEMNDEALAELFGIDTDKPIGDEGLDVKSPSSKSD